MLRLKPTFYATLALVVLVVAQLSLVELNAVQDGTGPAPRNHRPDVIQAHLIAVQAHIVLKTASPKSTLKRNLAAPPAKSFAALSVDVPGTSECEYRDCSVRNVLLSFIRDRGPPAAV